MSKVTIEKIYDALQNDWEMDFIIDKVKYHYEREINDEAKVLIQLYECGKSEDLFKGQYDKNSDYVAEILNTKMPYVNKLLKDCISDIEIEFETLSK